jgi:hypothetical protein
MPAMPGTSLGRRNKRTGDENDPETDSYLKPRPSGKYATQCHLNDPTTEKRRSFQLPASVAAAQHRSTVVECGYASVNQPLPQPVKIKTYSGQFAASAGI